MSLTPAPFTLRELVAENLRRLRGATSAQPQDVVRAARQFGLEWTAAWYSSLERGQKAISAEHLLALPPVLTAALAYRVSLSDLLLGNGSIHLGKPVDGTTLSLHYLRELITATPFRRSFLDFEEQEAPNEIPAPQAAAEKMREIVRANLGDVDVRDLARAEAGAGNLEAKLAKKLGVAEIVVIAAAASLWGRSMTEERDDQLHPEEGKPPARTTLGRKLAAEITQKLAESAEAAKARAAFVASSSSVTAQYPLVQLTNAGPPPQPAEIASDSRQQRHATMLPRQNRRNIFPPSQAQPIPDPEPEPAIAE